MNKNLNAIDRTVDYHAHILPGVDHGCRNMEMCERQLDFAAAAGVKTIISTSHFYPQNERVEEFTERRRQGLEKMLDAAGSRGISIIPSAETLWCPGIEKMEGLEELAAKEGGFNHILLELPFSEFDIEKVKRTMAKVHEQFGFGILLAHVERYDTKDILEFDSEYVHYQINARSLRTLRLKHRTGVYLRTGRVTAVGSDIHGTDNTYRYFRAIG